MILLSALILGLLVGLGRARWQGRSYRVAEIRLVWLAIVAFVPQLIAAYLPTTRSALPTWLGAALISSSLVLFLAFIWFNWRTAGMPVLFVGMALNLVVMLANGGWMPISPETAGHLRGGEAIASSTLGERFGQKDVLLLPQDTHLPDLSDRFLIPDWSPYRAAFSLGDILIAMGAFWIVAGAPSVATERSEP